MFRWVSRRPHLLCVCNSQSAIKTGCTNSHCPSKLSNSIATRNFSIFSHTYQARLILPVLICFETHIRRRICSFSTYVHLISKNQTAYRHNSCQYNSTSFQEILFYISSLSAFMGNLLPQSFLSMSAIPSTLTLIYSTSLFSSFSLYFLTDHCETLHSLLKIKSLLQFIIKHT